MTGLTGPYREQEPPARLCPRCRVGLDAREVGGEIVDECATCRGVFVRRTLLPRLVDPLDLGAEVQREFPPGHPRPVHGGPMYVRCPVCAALMNRRLFATGAKVVVDVCRDHGTWFDGAELRAVVDFAAGGGLERAAELDAQRARAEAAEAKRSRERAPWSGGRWEHEPTPEDGLAGLWQLLRALLR